MTRIIGIAALLFASAAAAQPAPPAPGPGAPIDADKKAQAKALYEKGLGEYNLGNFNAAIEAFTKAYELSAAPGLLFNIAQSHRLNKNYEKAGFFYTTYLRLKPDAANRADVEARIKEMDELIAEQKQLEARPPMGTMTPDGDSKSTPDANGANPGGSADASLGVTSSDRRDDLRSATTLQTAGLVTAGAGAALVVTGAIFGAMASSAASDLEGVTVWTPAEQAKYDAGKRNDTIAIVSLVVGGAAVVTGGTLWVLGRLKKSQTTVAIEPTRGGSTVAVGWAF